MKKKQYKKLLKRICWHNSSIIDILQQHTRQYQGTESRISDLNLLITTRANSFAKTEQEKMKKQFLFILNFLIKERGLDKINRLQMNALEEKRLLDEIIARVESIQTIN